MKRCAWATREPLIAYHDTEWGTPRHDERTLFEFLVLEGAQAGLSWETILRKRAAYRRAFARFDPKRVARFGARDVARLTRDAGIVRNRLKIASAIANAKAFLAVAGVLALGVVCVTIGLYGYQQVDPWKSQLGPWPIPTSPPAPIISLLPDPQRLGEPIALPLNNQSLSAVQDLYKKFRTPV